MKTKFTASAIALMAATAAGAEGHLPQATNAWYEAGQARLAAELAKEINTNRAKNVILLIADGNGVGTNYATRLFAGQQAGNFGDEHVLPHESFPNLALVKTYNVNAQTPDSAGTGTAMMSGVKTDAGVLGVNEAVNRSDCASIEGNLVSTMNEIMTEAGKSTGVVSTARLTHATPASGYAHSVDRNYEASLPEGCETQKDIATQLVDAMEAGIIDVALGGGRRNFIGKDITDEEGKTGKRAEGENLIDRAKSLGIQYAWNDETIAAATTDAPILGLFESSHMQYEADRSGEPSLAEMVEVAIKNLQGNENGFFLQVEAGRVDHANHAGNLARVVRDGIAFTDAVAMADKLTNDEDTLIIVTADHEHAIAFSGYAGRGADITGLCMGISNTTTEHTGEPCLAKDGKPYTIATYLNGAGSILREDMNWAGVRPDLTQEEATDLDYTQQALIPMSSETHSGEDVAVYAKGPWAHLFDGTIEQNYVFHVMKHAAEVNVSN
ncbi:alkaline phosphatase [Cognatishimia maritima]|uniref:Alkaline phosphatase n=1 Tax=Cognatishimia maritima TaxID=870908 RepID=A0A1M5P2X3_9RHOB|nr:alkaline phosphatase [Cognatishimia maritima]SHG96065.1 alkaline phosphatase [Cognatishimia maritima]